MISFISTYKSVVPPNKPLIIAGNAPSLREIDYTRLPENFEENCTIFRANQFYCESKYYLGKSIDMAFFNIGLVKPTHLTYHMLNERKEYAIKEYCNTFGITGFLANDEYDILDIYLRMKLCYPRAKLFIEYLLVEPEFHELLMHNVMQHHKRVTASIAMLIVGMAMGYKEIYMAGVDFYSAGSHTYVYEQSKQNIKQLVPGFNNPKFVSPFHNKETEVEFLNLAHRLIQKRGGVLFSVCPKSPLTDYIPLAPNLHDKPYMPQTKPKDFIDDIMVKYIPPTSPPRINHLKDALGILDNYE